MHRSIAAAAAIVAFTAALTACGGSDGDGGKAGPTKETRSSAAAEPGGEKSPEAAPSSASSTGAKLGDTLSLVGIVGLGQSGVAPTADVTLNKFVDNAKPSLGAFAPEDGSRLVAAEFTIVNTGQITYGDDPYRPPTVIDAAGGEHHGKPGDSDAGKSLGGGIIMNIPPGQRITGWVIFDVPKGVKVTSVTFLMDRTGPDAERTGRWTL